MRLFWSVLLLLIFIPGWTNMAPNDHLDRSARITVVPVSIRPGASDRRVGRLTFLRGYRLTSRDSAFGGFSSLSVDGDRFTLLSDGGEILRFALDSQGRLTAPVTASLPAGPGTGWDKADRDSESMTRDPATGQIWVGFENSNEIWRYSPGFAQAERRAARAAMHDWPLNGGAESMVRLRSGAFVVLAEQATPRHGPGRIALRFDGDPTVTKTPPVRFIYLPPDGFDPSDATELPDGRLIVLNRHFSLRHGFTVIVTIIDPAAIRPGARVRGVAIARFAGDVLHDNYEGIAVARDGGRPVLWIVSDDNQSDFQQTLLLEFRLDPAAPDPAVDRQSAPARARGRPAD